MKHPSPLVIKKKNRDIELDNGVTLTNQTVTLTNVPVTMEPVIIIEAAKKFVITTETAKKSIITTDSSENVDQANNFPAEQTGSSKINESNKRENLSDLENRIVTLPKEKKIDNKNDDKTIVNIINKQGTNTNMESQTIKVVDGSTTQQIQQNQENSTTNQTVEQTTEEKSKPLEQANYTIFHWPDLSVDNINTSFKVIGDLQVGAKVKIVNNSYLAEDNSWVPSVSRNFGEAPGREKIMSFLDHLFSETKRNIEYVLGEIRKGTDIDSNVSVLEGILYHMDIFLHRYENMRNVYKGDSGTFAKLGVNRNKFFTYKNTFFRNVIIPK